jgi:anti-anti-sigma regulatory factor
VTAPIRRVIELAGLHDVFETFASREEALAKLAAG